MYPGVPQGKVLSRMLYITYVTEMFNVQIEGSLYSYVDDTTLIMNLLFGSYYYFPKIYILEYCSLCFYFPKSYVPEFCFPGKYNPPSLYTKNDFVQSFD